jgi:hypothetical protein
MIFQTSLLCERTYLKKKARWLTVCVTCVWAGRGNAWEQKKPEARKMLENAAESHTSGARCVGRWCCYFDSLLIAAIAFVTALFILSTKPG